MSTTEWTLVAQVAAAVAAAVAAVAAWRATRQVARKQDEEFRLQQDAALKAIHADVSQLLTAKAINKMPEAMIAWLNLRAKLVLVRYPLPKTFGLLQVPLADLNPKQHSQGPLEEIEKAIQDVWTHGRKPKDVMTIPAELPTSPVESSDTMRDSTS